LNNSFIIVDEAQNTTGAQMKMVLTKIWISIADGGDEIFNANRFTGSSYKEL